MQQNFTEGNQEVKQIANVGAKGDEKSWCTKNARNMDSDNEDAGGAAAPKIIADAGVAS